MKQTCNELKPAEQSGISIYWLLFCLMSEYIFVFFIFYVLDAVVFIVYIYRVALIVPISTLHFMLLSDLNFLLINCVSS